MIQPKKKEFYNVISKQVTFFVLFTFIFGACTPTEKKEYTELKDGKKKAATFVGSETCKSCHQDEFKDWQGSHHDLAMMLPDSTSVKGNFENTKFTHQSITSTFFKKENSYYVNTQGQDGVFADFKIEYTFGVTPLQQYLIKFPNGEYQCLSVAWDSIKEKWFSLNSEIDINHGDWLHWTGGAMSWNTMCADCHSTDLKKNYDSKTDTYKTTFSEIDVSCEACHGPSSSHVAFYENPSEEFLPPNLYMDTEMTSKELVEKCARCHSRRTQLTKYFDYKGNYTDHYSPSLITDPLYELDGQILDEDYVYGSFIQSKMYHYGVSCKDCHDVHTLKLKKQGNGLCLSCHIPSYNEPSHHFHEINTEGAQCINCHMPGKTYMGNDFRRDHSFRVPRPDQTVSHGVSNSCNGCHDDKTADWASKVIIEKYGEERADHFSDYLLKGYYGDLYALEHLMSNAKYPTIARASALNLYSNNALSQREINKVLQFLNDPSEVVRSEAVRSLELMRLQSEEIAQLIEPLLKDSLRMVRISAAQYFNMVGIDVNANPDFKKANKEYLEGMNLNADFAPGQHQIALYYQAKGKDDSAIKSYERAIKIDGYHNRSRMNLALLYYQKGRVLDAEKLYLKVITQEPEFSYSYYMLGLLYNEIGTPEKALEYLSKSVTKQPANINAFYNYALMLQKKGENKKSIEIAEKGLLIFSNNERLLYVKLLGEINIKNRNAIETCNQLIQIAPNNQNYQQIMLTLRDK
ncbi:MAG: tetratricopeptide repeat protein [Flavobacteriaceae bacterium]|nr:tetratricopeptide repeat protein [Flavobacteriaceae bacterium]